MEEVLKQILEQLSQMNGRMGNMESRMDSIEGRMGNMESRMDSIEGRMGNMESRMDSIEGRMGNMESRMANIEHEQKQMNYRMTGIENEQKSLREEMNQRFDELKDSISRKHIESIRADELILQSLDEVRESVRFVNRRIADTELDVISMKKSLKQ